MSELIIDLQLNIECGNYKLMGNVLYEKTNSPFESYRPVTHYKYDPDDIYEILKARKELNEQNQS